MKFAAQSWQPPAFHKTMVRSGYAPVNGLEMYFEVHGAGPPLVSIHPALGTANVFPALAGRHRLVAMDLQGHGRTADVDRPISFEQHADDIVGLMDYLGIREANVLGECWGGTTALVLASRYPDRVRKVAVYGASAEVTSTPPISADCSAVAFVREHYHRIAPDPDGWSVLFDKIQSVRWAGFTPSMFAHLGVPVLVGVGDHDFIPVETAMRLATMIPGAQLAVIPGAGHFLLNVRPEKFLDLADAFFTADQPALPFATPLSGYVPGENQ